MSCFHSQTVLSLRQMRRVGLAKKWKNPLNWCGLCTMWELCNVSSSVGVTASAAWDVLAVAWVGCLWGGHVNCCISLKKGGRKLFCTYKFYSVRFLGLDFFFFLVTFWNLYFKTWNNLLNPSLVKSAFLVFASALTSVVCSACFRRIQEMCFFPSSRMGWKCVAKHICHHWESSCSLLRQGWQTC